MILGLGIWELVLLGGIIVALFGLKQVPQVTLQLGRIHGLVQRVRGWFRHPFRFF